MSQLRPVVRAVATRRNVLQGNEGFLHGVNVGYPQLAVTTQSGQAFGLRRKKVLWHRRLLFDAEASIIVGSNDLGETDFAVRRMLSVDNVGPFLFLQSMLKFRCWFVVILSFHGVGITALLKGKSV